MIRICFVCLGNICRSPMAEYIMKDKINKLGLSNKIYITSRATSYEEEGNDIYPPAKRELDKHNIKYNLHQAKRLEKKDINNYDYIVAMEESNINRINNILETKSNKVIKLLDKDIDDPWYTRDFDTTYKELDKGINILINKLFNR